MTWKTITQKDTFKDLAQKICQKDEAKYSLLYGMILDDIFGDYKMLHYNEQAIAFQTSPSRPIVISDLTPQIAREFARWLETQNDTKELVGTKETVNLILDQMRSSEPNMPELVMAQKIYRIDKIEMPKIDYKLRQANPKDHKIVSDWFYQFMLDAYVMQSPKKELISKMAEKRINNNEVYLLIKDGNPAAMVCSNRPTTNGITINGVFTPIEHRGTGLATQAVALLTKKLLDEYSFCCLYTDLNNPTSNKIYTRIGYEPVCDSLHFKIRT